jgi:hypothetical protein
LRETCFPDLTLKKGGGEGKKTERTRKSTILISIVDDKSALNASHALVLKRMRNMATKVFEEKNFLTSLS